MDVWIYITFIFFFYLYSAEGAQMLIRNVNYEIPALKRQIAKCKQSQSVSPTKLKTCNSEWERWKGADGKRILFIHFFHQKACAHNLSIILVIGRQTK